MEARELCQQLLDHIVEELPEEQDAALSLAALAAFHPDEVRLFVTEAMALLMRNRCPVPEYLVLEVSRRMASTRTLEAR